AAISGYQPARSLLRETGVPARPLEMIRADGVEEARALGGQLLHRPAPFLEDDAVEVREADAADGAAGDDEKLNGDGGGGVAAQEGHERRDVRGAHRVEAFVLLGELASSARAFERGRREARAGPRCDGVARDAVLRQFLGDRDSEAHDAEFG